MYDTPNINIRINIRFISLAPFYTLRRLCYLCCLLPRRGQQIIIWILGHDCSNITDKLVKRSSLTSVIGSKLINSFLPFKEAGISAAKDLWHRQASH